MKVLLGVYEFHVSLYHRERIFEGLKPRFAGMAKC